MNAYMFLPIHLRDKAERYCAVMQETTGVDPLESSRRRPVVTARMMVAYALLQDGYTLNATGTILGMDHATISHYKDRMGDVLKAPGYEAERAIWNKFKKTIWK